MATAPSSTNVFVELTSHTIHLAVTVGQKIVALRAFALDEKAAIAEFIKEHKLSGATRVSLLASKNFIAQATDEESATVRQPTALTAYVAKADHGFGGTPFSVAVDSAGGSLPDSTLSTPWLIASVDSDILASSKILLTELGLSCTNITLAAPVHLGTVLGSLSANETALVLIPGDNDAHIAWVSSDGVQSVVKVDAGFSKIYEAVQLGLGLKFRAAAGRLFYNDNYDFTESSPKIAEHLASVLKPLLTGSPSTHLHIAGLLPWQSWLVESVANLLGLSAWKPSPTTDIETPAANAAVALLAKSGNTDAPWVQSSLDTQTTAKPKSSPPSAQVEKSQPSTSKATSTQTAKPAVATAPKATVTQVTAPSVKSSTRQPTPQPTTSSPAIATAVATTPAADEPSTKTQPKGKKAPILIATVGLLVVAAGLAAYFGTTGSTTAETPTEATTKPAVIPPAPVPAQPVQPVVVEKPAPAQPKVSDDLFPNERLKYGNARYQIELSDKGRIEKITTAKGEILIATSTGINLQNASKNPSGASNVKKATKGSDADMGNTSAIVKKSIRDGNTVFTVSSTNPRFKKEQTFICLSNCIKVEVSFTPLIEKYTNSLPLALYPIQVAQEGLNRTSEMKHVAPNLKYPTKYGPLIIEYDNKNWSESESNQTNTFTAGEGGVIFKFILTKESTPQQLTYSIWVP